MEKPTKYYSIKQEKYIAGVLGWQTVSGSGARDCHPGDVESDEFSGECKTHTSEKTSISIKQSWWDKIRSEASYRHRTPVLFVDNGNIKNTWVVTYYTKPMYSDSYPFPFKVNTNINFKVDALNRDNVYFINEWQNYAHVVVLMSLEKFAEVVHKR